MLRPMILLLAVWTSVGVAAQERPATSPAASTRPSSTRPAGADDANASYPIRLVRPSKVGDRAWIHAVGATRTRSTRTIDGEQRKPEIISYGVFAEGTLEVLEVTKEGIDTKLSFTVDSCVAKVDKQDVPLFPKGTVLVGAWDGGERGTVFTLDGHRIPEGVDDLLELIFTTGDPESTSDEEIYGTSDRRKVGDVWPINGAAASRDFARIGMEVREEDLFGQTTVVDRVSVEGVPALTLRTEFKARSIKSSDQKRKEQKLTLVSGDMSSTTSVTLPVDTSLQPTRAQFKMTINREMAGVDDNGKEVRTMDVIEREWERDLRPVKP